MNNINQEQAQRLIQIKRATRKGDQPSLEDSSFLLELLEAMRVPSFDGFEVLEQKQFDPEKPIGSCWLSDHVNLEFYDELLVLHLTDGRDVVVTKANQNFGQCDCCGKLNDRIHRASYEDCDEEERAEGPAWISGYTHFQLKKA